MLLVEAQRLGGDTENSASLGWCITAKRRVHESPCLVEPTLYELGRRGRVKGVSFTPTASLDHGKHVPEGWLCVLGKRDGYVRSGILPSQTGLTADHPVLLLERPLGCAEAAVPEKGHESDCYTSVLSASASASSTSTPR